MLKTRKEAAAAASPDQYIYTFSLPSERVMAVLLSLTRKRTEQWVASAVWD